MQSHDLHHEFPQFEQKIIELKNSDQHFKKLFDEYHGVNKEIHHIESGAEATSDDVLTNLRKKRLHLKDDLYVLLNK